MPWSLVLLTKQGREGQEGREGREGQEGREGREGREGQPNCVRDFALSLPCRLSLPSH